MAYSFTAEQQRAIAHREGNLHLIACAGSGKTEVLANRIANLLDPSFPTPYLPRNIVAFTFTEKAAGELKERVYQRCEERYGREGIVGMAEMFVGTIHAFCLDLLQTEVPEYLKFGVLNEVQQVLLVDRNSKKSGLTQTTTLKGEKLKRWVDTSRYIACMDILREAELDHAALSGSSVIAGLQAYEALLEEKRHFDYSSILSLAAHRLETDPILRQRIGERVRQVIVDEYQDVNPVQERLVRAMADLGAHVCVVGDDDQTIYQFRGSDVDQILTFTRRYPAVQQIALAENFRSSEAVVSVARDFIVNNTRRLPKQMINTDAQPHEKGDVCALAFDDPEAEAAWVAETIQSLHGVAFAESKGATERGLAYSDMAILLRSVKNNGAVITDALRRAGIPFVVSGMNNLFESPEAEAARQLFYFVGQDGPGDPRALFDHWKHADLGVADDDLRSAIAYATEQRDEFRSSADAQRWAVYNIQRLYLHFLELVGLREEQVPDPHHTGRGEVVFYNLGRFSQLISDFESIHFHSNPLAKYQTFAKFLEKQADDAYPEGGQDVALATPNAVRIMTVHQAKGMQWPVVFLPALLRNRFPAPRMGGRQSWHIIPSNGVRDFERYKGDIEDERRLFYVALTRAQKFLYLTWAPIPGSTRYSRHSDFWEDVLSSKFVKRSRPRFDGRRRLPPQPKRSVANVTLTFSDLKYFLECPYQFKLRVLYGFNAPLAEALGYGKSLHDALAEVHRRAIDGDIADPSEAPALVETHLHVPYAYEKLEDKLRASAEASVVRYLEQNALDDVEFSEKTVEINFGNGVRVKGRIDLVRRRDTNETTIVDLKSTQRAQAENVTEAQLHVYALGYRELCGRDADFVEIYNLDEDRKDNKARSVDEDLIEHVQSEVRRTAQALRTNDFEPQPRQRTCRDCDYLALCTKGQAELKRT